MKTFKSSFRKILSRWLFLTLPVVSVAQQPFSCDGAFYLIADAANGNSRMLRIEKDSSAANNSIVKEIAGDLGKKVTAMGYNVADNFIYALEWGTWHLLRIGSDGMVTDLGFPLYLNPNLEYHAGEVRPLGGNMYVIGRKPGSYDVAMYSIRLQAPYPAGLTSIVSDFPVRISDMAFNPVFGSLIGYNEWGKHLVNISAGGLVTNIRYEVLAKAGSIGALFFDRHGLLYGLDNSGEAGKNLVRFNLVNGQVSQAFHAQGSGRTDGCSCPYRIGLFKRYEPDFVLPCTQTKVTYTFHNTAATAYGQTIFSEAFPPEFSISEILRRPYSQIASGVGADILRLENMEVLLNKDSVVIRLSVGNFSGIHNSQARLEKLPAGLGYYILSDNPATTTRNDPTAIHVAPSAHIIRPRQPLLCDGGGTWLEAAAGGFAYRWSNGDTTQRILATRPGRYQVEVLGPCGIYFDTVEVSQVTVLKPDLGPDLQVPYGSEVYLQTGVAPQDDLSWHWEVMGGKLNCQSCSNPSLRVSDDVLVILTIRNQNGCHASDTLQISLIADKEIFFPNVFSPNGDGINDFFYPQANGFFPFRNFCIYDRWGGLIFEKKNGIVGIPADGWSGDSASKEIQPGEYSWRTEIILPDGNVQLRTGTVQLLR